MGPEAAFVGFIPTSDLAAAQAFYVDTLGLSVIDESPFALAVDAGGGIMLRLTVVGEFVPQPFTVAGWAVPELSDTVRTLTAAGVEFVRYEGMEQDDLGIWAAPSGGRVAWFRDRDGNTLSLTTF